MRYLAIAFFIFCIHGSIAITNATGIFDVAHPYASDWYSSLDATELSDAQYAESTVNSANTNFGFGDFVKGLYYFVLAVGLGIIWIPFTFEMFGLVAPFTYFFSVPIYFLYFVALAEWISNRSTGGMR